MFRALKARQPEPNPELALAIGGEEVEAERPALNVLRSLPGITAHNLHKVAKAVGSIAELAALPLEEMGKLMGVANAQK